MQKITPTNDKKRQAMNLAMQGKLQEAKAIYLQVCASDPRDAEAFFFAGVVNRNLGLLEDAATYYRMAIRIKPDYSEAFDSLGSVLQAQGKIKEAVPYYSHALRIKPENFGAHYNLATAYAALGSLSLAVDHFQESIRLKPDLLISYTSCSQVFSILGRIDEATKILVKVLSISPEFPLALRMLGHLYTQSNRNNDATAVLNQALKLEPESAAVISALANILARKEEYAKAYELLKPAIPENCDDAGVALVFSGICKSLRREDEAIALLEKVLNNNRTALLSRIRLHHNLATLFDNKADYESAFRHHEKSNQLKTYKFDLQENKNLFNRIKSTYSQKNLKKFPHAEISKEKIIFIVGMPRSGTSLVEQILDCHPSIQGAGELSLINNLTQQLPEITHSGQTFPECMHNIDQTTLEEASRSYIETIKKFFRTADMVTDKMPLNFQFLGLIQQLFPHARVIHCRRNPRDTCLSCYFQDFDARLTFTNNLEHIRKYYLQYRDLMSHWERTCTLPTLTLQYESLVNDPESRVREMLEFCDLEWEPNCLEFHKNKRFVKTASHAQVTQPMYKGSVGRWKNYKEFLNEEFMTLQ